MSLSTNASIFLTATRLGFFQSLRMPATALAQFAAYACIVVFYGYILKAIPVETLTRLGVSASDLVWYPAATEICLFSFSAFAARRFQAVLMDGGYEVSLLRPSAGWIPFVGEWYGAGVASFLLMALPAFFMTWVVAGALPSSPFFAVGFVVSLGLTGFCLSCLHFLIGACCMWLRQAEPVLWVVYKTMFLLGALMWPLSFYPEWMAQGAWVTPFPALIAVAGHWVLPLPLLDQIAGVLVQVFWACLFVLATSVTDRRILRRCQKAVMA